MFPTFSVVAPCQRGASPPSVRHRLHERQHSVLERVWFGGAA
jgi:hypothetical protein